MDSAIFENNLYLNDVLKKETSQEYKSIGKHSLNKNNFPFKFFSWLSIKEYAQLLQEDLQENSLPWFHSH
jgi:hypothetical protein